MLLCSYIYESEVAIKMTENMKKEVAKNAVSYLKNRMIINQILIKMSDQKIDFEKFISLYSSYVLEND